MPTLVVGMRSAAASQPSLADPWPRKRGHGTRVEIALKRVPYNNPTVADAPGRRIPRNDLIHAH